MITANNLKFHYWQLGQGPDLVMIHGLGGNLAVWHLKMVPLLRQNYQVLTYDLRGHGRSATPPSGYTTADQADDLWGLLNELGIEQAHLAGHSLGADIALHFALRYPERVGGLILIEPGLPALIHLRKGESWIGWSYWAEVIEKYSGHKVPLEKRTDYKYLLRQSGDIPILFGPAQGNYRKTEKFIEVLETTTLVKDYEEAGELTLENIATIPHPKLLIYDRSSPYLDTYYALCEVASNYRTVLLDTGELRHFFPLEQPELLVEHIRAFLETDELQPVMVSPGSHASVSLETRGSSNMGVNHR
jgi:pimeloyl-ACP methyl ester carboxylesterase